MMLLVPRDRVGEVVDRVWNVSSVVDARRLQGIVCPPDHVDVAELVFQVSEVVVEDHLQMNAVACVGEILSAGGRILALGKGCGAA